jgi:type I restriction enzyme, S subunit
MATDGLPGDWKAVPLGGVFRREARSIEVEAAGRYREIGIRSHGKGVFHKEEIIGASLGNKRVFEVVPGALAMNIVFAWEGAVAVVSESERGMIASHRFPMYVPCGAVEVDVEFIRRFFQTKRGIELLGDASPGGAGRNRTLNQKFAAEIPLPVPPIAEQRKIAAILSSVDDAIEATRAVIDQLQVVKKTMMAELLTRGMPGRHKRFRQTEIGEVPAEWAVVRLATVATVGNGSTPSRQRADYWSHGTVPWLPTGKVNDRVIQQTDAFVTERALAECPIRLLPRGTLLVAMIGQGKTRGKVAYLAIEATINQNFAFVAPGPEVVSWFLFSYLENNYERLRADGRGSNQGALNCGLIKQWLIPLPPPDEQTQISDAALRVDARITAESSMLAGLVDVKTALMSVLLTGDVRVMPDEVGP